MIIGMLLVSLLSSKYILPLIIEFAGKNLKRVKNYRGNYIINSVGLFFSINIVLICTTIIVSNLLFNNTNEIDTRLTALTTGVFSSTFTGFLDDSVNDSAKGITGHTKRLLKGNITSGSIKACIGVFTSLIIGLIYGYTGLNLLLSMAIIFMMQNFINLLDLRPLRAAKAYAAFSLIYFIYSLPGQYSIYTGINIGILTSLLFYIRYEASETCMMGDTGSNVLGVTLGVLFTSIDRMLFKTVLLSFLMIVQVYAEKKSISKLIEGNKLLYSIDMLGRRKYYDKNKKGNS